jgi:hypothetical protein
MYVRAAARTGLLSATTGIAAIAGGGGVLVAIGLGIIESRAAGGWAKRCPHVTQKRTLR